MSSEYLEACPGKESLTTPDSGLVQCVDSSQTVPAMCSPQYPEENGKCVVERYPNGGIVTTNKSECPTGYRFDYDQTRQEFGCFKIIPSSCPAGTTARIAVKKNNREPPRPICIPNTVAVYDVTVTPDMSPASWPCMGDDRIMFPIAGTLPNTYQCLPSTPATGAASANVSVSAPSPDLSMTTPSAADLQQQYTEKLQTYETTLRTALSSNDSSKLPELQRLNSEMNRLIEQLLNELKTSPQKIRVKREELVSTLSRIQRDYNALKNGADDLTLLRRIREGETGATNKEFQFYLGLFLVLCLGILAMIFFGGQIKLATAISPMTPARTAPFA